MNEGMPDGRLYSKIHWETDCGIEAAVRVIGTA